MWPSEASPWLGTFVKTQYHSLLERGIDITVVNIKSRKSGGSNFNYVLNFFRILICSFNKKYELLHLHHWICWVVCLPIFWKRKIYTVHEGEFFIGGLRKFIINQAIKYSDGVIFVNRGMYLTYKNRYKSKPMSFIPCGVDTKVFQLKNKLHSKQKLALDTDKQYLFFPACPKRSAKNAQLLKQWDSRLNKGKYEILWGGQISFEQMADCMNASEAVLTLSDYESDGMVVKESLACGVPVISTNVGNSRYYLSNLPIGTVIKPTLRELDKAINKVVNIGHAEPQLAPEFELENVATKVVDFYQRVQKSYV